MKGLIKLVVFLMIVSLLFIVDVKASSHSKTLEPSKSSKANNEPVSKNKALNTKPNTDGFSRVIFFIKENIIIIIDLVLIKISIGVFLFLGYLYRKGYLETETLSSRKSVMATITKHNKIGYDGSDQYDSNK